MIENVVRFEKEPRLEAFPKFEESSCVTNIELVHVRRRDRVTADEEWPRGGERIAIQDCVRCDILLVARRDIGE